MSDTAPAQQPQTLFIDPEWVTRSHVTSIDQVDAVYDPASTIKNISQALVDEVYQELADRLMHFQGGPIRARLILRVDIAGYPFPVDEIEDTPENREAFQHGVERLGIGGNFIAIDYYPRQETPVMPQDLDPDEDEIGAPPHEPPQPS